MAVAEVKTARQERGAKRVSLAMSGARHDAHFLDRPEMLDFIDLYITMSRRKQEEPHP